ncbi:unnamed protein product [Cylindrotheca closterium]|uniref:DnaJ-like protein C11 C-terminal domain-containing protein n=1 Tax=Cylindrotheca closterium TaxID=2856 RepID=A0AAD2CGJ3_9STRA|nr:unnamed protein product [Cylindrotheca closterium]
MESGSLPVDIENNQFVSHVAIRKFDPESMKGSSGDASGKADDENPNLAKSINEASFELAVECTDDGFKISKDAEVTIYKSMPPSRVGGPWSGSIEGTTTVGPSTKNTASGSVTLDYKASPWSNLSLGMIRGHELFYPLVSLGGTLMHGGSKFGVTFYHNVNYLHAMVLEHSMFSISFHHAFPNTRWVLMSAISRRKELSLAITNSKLSGRLCWNLRKPNEVETRFDVRPMISKDKRAHLFCNFRPGSWQLGASLIQSLHSQMATIGMGVRLYSIRGLEWILSWNRGDATIRIPILISRTIKPMSAVQALYFGMVSFFIQEGIAEVWGWKSIEDEGEEDNSAPVFVNTAKTREDAEMQKELMMRQAKRRKRDEAEKDGLVIQSAVYEAREGDSWDVTVPLQFWVSKSSLTLPKTSKSQLLGFYNVAEKVVRQRTPEAMVPLSWWQDSWKDLWESTEEVGNLVSSDTALVTLRVTYDFKGASYTITVRDEEELILPNPRATQLAKAKD